MQPSVLNAAPMTTDAVPYLTNFQPTRGLEIAADAPHIGVLALQGAFVEHINALGQLGVRVSEVRQIAHLTDDLDGLVIPGGESTTMAIVARTLDLVEPLQEFVRSGRPVFGTCAGLIFLSDRATGQKIGGQSLIGGLDVTAHRNFFGSQIDSAERPVVLAGSIESEHANDGFRHAFIRAPVIIKVGEGVQVLATLKANAREQALLEEQLSKVKDGASSDSTCVIIGVQQGNILATSFHPELTEDLTWHRHFVAMVAKHATSGAKRGSASK
ncbi:PdxT/SNO family [Pavlovales sp. CCMP2436]|nr:PdxT/SNO family [Pavlovales sp. CCMP2436]|mmetsp:Transcript_36773/g.86378  ORF Transcript_36773/g.86378 Transcript_36773/m.86378 type:complete len:271 (+) Transcript_36773:46-858(+)